MLSYLTHKLRTPELNGSSAFHTKTDDDHDSGTESDDESAEIEELQKYMEHSIQLEDGSGHHSPSGRRKVVLCQHATRFRHTQQTQQQTQQQDTQQQQPNNKPMERRRGQPAHHHQPVSGPAVVTALLSATVAAGVGRGPAPTSVGAAGCVGGGSPVLLDSALPSDSDPNLEQHSSEEELEVINNRAGSAEKRKWSQANQRRARGARASLRRSRSDGAAGDTSSDEEEYDAASVAGDAALAVNGALSNGGRSDDDDDEEDDDDEDDEEVRDLTWSGGSRCEAANGVHSSSNASSCSSQRSSSSSATVVPPAPVEFRASPPLHVHRPYNGSPPPKVFHAAAPVGGVGLGPTTLTLSASAHIPAFEVCAVSPRKRHRQDRGGGTAFGVFSLVDGGPVQRPCLDFEKMQQIRVKLL